MPRPHARRWWSSCSPRRAVTPARRPMPCLGELARRPDVIALSLHVDYWDYIGWKDPFGSPMNTARQRRYAEALGLRYVYTPQMIVDGRINAVGSRRDEVLDANRARRQAARRVRPPFRRERRGQSGDPGRDRAPKTGPRSGWRFMTAATRPRSSAARTPGASCATPTWCAASSASALGWGSVSKSRWTLPAPRRGAATAVRSSCRRGATARCSPPLPSAWTCFSKRTVRPIVQRGAGRAPFFVVRGADYSVNELIVLHMC